MEPVAIVFNRTFELEFMRPEVLMESRIDYPPWFWRVWSQMHRKYEVVFR